MSEYKLIEVARPDDVDIRVVYNRDLTRRVKVSNVVPVNVGKKFVVFGMYVANAVTAGDIPALKQAINSIEGVQACKALMYGQSPPAIPANTELILHVDMHLRIEDAT